MKYQYCRHKYQKIPVACLVSEKEHTNYTAYTSSDKRKNKECCFRYPVRASSCLVLVDSHGGKTCQINYSYIRCNEKYRIHFEIFFLPLMPVSFFEKKKRLRNSHQILMQIVTLATFLSNVKNTQKIMASDTLYGNCQMPFGIIRSWENYFFLTAVFLDFLDFSSTSCILRARTLSERPKRLMKPLASV